MLSSFCMNYCFVTNIDKVRFFDTMIGPFSLPLYPLVSTKTLEYCLLKNFLNSIVTGVLPEPPATKFPTYITGIF